MVVAASQAPTIAFRSSETGVPGFSTLFTVSCWSAGAGFSTKTCRTEECRQAAKPRQRPCCRRTLFSEFAGTPVRCVSFLQAKSRLLDPVPGEFQPSAENPRESEDQTRRSRHARRSSERKSQARRRNQQAPRTQPRLEPPGRHCAQPGAHNSLPGNQATPRFPNWSCPESNSRELVCDIVREDVSLLHR